MPTYDPFPNDDLLGAGSPYRTLETVGPKARRKRLRANMAGLDLALNNALVIARGDDIAALQMAIVGVAQAFARALESPAATDDDDL